MNRNYATEHIYHTPGVYTISVTAVADATVQLITIYPGEMTLTVTSAPDNHMSAWAQTTGAVGTMAVDWGDGTVSNVTAANLNGGFVNHVYAQAGDWLVQITPVGWPTVNGPIAHTQFTSSIGLPVLYSITPQAVAIGDTITVTGLNLDASGIEHLWVGGAECLVPGWYGAATILVTSIPSYCSGLVGEGPQDVTVVSNVGEFTLPQALAITG
jgi:hypothetical protein